MKYQDAFINGFADELEKTAWVAALGRGLLSAGKWAKSVLPKAKNLVTSAKATVSAKVPKLMSTAKEMAPTMAMQVGVPRGGMPKTPKAPKSVQSTSGKAYQAPGAP